MTFNVDHTKKLTLLDLKNFLADSDAKVALSEATKKSILKCRNFLDEKLKNNNDPIYGINTGFGSLCNVIIPDNDLEQLQENLVKSHACGLGLEVPQEVVKLMLFLKIQSLSYGKSGVQLQTVERLCDFINHKIYPVIYQQGSLGASGDLAPLAHLSLPLLGLGKVNYKNKQLNAIDVLKENNLSPIKLKSKEGLALLNGTQFMSAYGCYCLIKSEHLNTAADFITAVSLDAFDGRIDPFKDNLHTIRAHAGQLQTARDIRKYLEGSEIGKQEKKQVQDPYSFRCAPQVHGATKDTVNYVKSVFETEINSVTDNPTIFPDDDEILSGGNFHGQPLALALDFLCIAMAELGSISERRTYLLISGQRGLPPFLAAKAGLNSGFMIPQYTAASIVSQSKQLCTPASIDSIVSSNGQEDHVSMGANAATKCFLVIENTEKVLAIELLNAAQALELKRPLKSSEKVEALISTYRKSVSFMEKDEVLYELINASHVFINNTTF
ncbi:MAG: histidine ammonia-lyase [Bacteroidota bacterium]|nr:histidine ammonia-lyase [Bacteroidota bacterium]MDP3144491.1 histidine ammonia-lyase [Bacteroidota bacterium]